MTTNLKMFSLIVGYLITLSHLTIAQDTHQITLTVEVNHLRNDKGMVQFALYNKEGSIPDEKYLRYYKIGRSPITSFTTKYEFTNLPPGMYAVNILHDENKNEAIDIGLLKPKEGIGFSNFSTIGLINRPNFSKAKFEVMSDQTIEVKVIYF